LNSENFNISPASGVKSLGKLRILVAPLDWGLGHATRCIPIIHELLRQDCEVWLAAEGGQEALLKKEFPSLPLLNLRGYRVKYGRSAIGLVWNLLNQVGQVIKAIGHENKWLKKIVAEHGFDAVIADNRFGLYHQTIPCIFITHQLTIKSPLGKWTERILQKRNYQYINRFAECWVPDEERLDNLAGELSHPRRKPTTIIKYLGILSRFERDDAIAAEKGRLLIILSGPEPQRTILENKIIKDIAHYPGYATIVRGLPGSNILIPSTNQIRFYNHLPAEELNKEINRAEYVISRSGYSTIMDIAKLRKKGILVPTPGQAEQEYLAWYMQLKQLAMHVDQRSFSLQNALQLAGSFDYLESDIENKNGLQPVITSFINSIIKH
jgi:uncharacterized protein (TIGR00661 family)